MKRRNFIKTVSAGLAASSFSSLPIPVWGNNSLNKAPAEGIQRFGDGRDWFFQKRFGMFVHWGLYAIPAWHEQYQWRARIPRSEYVKYVQQWNPTKFNPEKWLDLMQEVGMEYICLTTKHHDGFCLWDTKQTSFNVMNTPYKRDIVGMLSEACHKRDIPLCLYYSIVDWHQPNYPNEGRHHELSPQSGDLPDWQKYMAFLKAQVRELCTNYGKINGFWWDMNVPQYKDTSVNALIRSLQADAVINNRGFDEGDFGTPERDYEQDNSMAFNRPTEANQSVGMESWGYRSNEDYYTDRHLIRSIDRYLARDANYLLNVGPMPDGRIAPSNVATLKRIGKWYQSVKEALIDIQPVSRLTSNRNVMLTRRNNTLYVHLNADPQGDSVKLHPIETLPKSAILLNDNRQLEALVELLPADHSTRKQVLRLRNLPVNKMANTVLVAKLEFDKIPASNQAQPANQKTDILEK